MFLISSIITYIYIQERERLTKDKYVIRSVCKQADRDNLTEFVNPAHQNYLQTGKIYVLTSLMFCQYELSKSLSAGNFLKEKRARE